MTGAPWERKPSTSSGELPPLHTVAPKFSRSRLGLVFVARGLLVEIPQDGSGTRSGKADGGGFRSSGTAGAVGSVVPCVTGRRECPKQQPVPFTTVTVTLVVASCAVIWNSRTYLGVMVAVTL